jgi:hypothetical protein
MSSRKTRALTGMALSLVCLLFAAGAVKAAFFQWSESAGSNASADPTINFREGMPPSAVNDSGRAVMAALAGYRDDISGLLTTTGTASAYLVSTNQVLPNPPNDGQQLSVTVNVTNGMAPTLSADGGTAFPIQSSPGSAVASASLIQGSPYTFRFSVANSAWMLQGFYGSALTVPLGGMIPYTLTTVPNSNFVFPAGQCLSTTTFATYWNALGQPASGTCPGGQFRIIDLSGSVPAGLDTMPGFSAANRLTSSATGCGTAMTSVGARCANGLQSRTLTAAQIPAISFSGSGTASVTGSVASATQTGSSTTGGGAFAFNTFSASANGFSASGSVSVSGSSTNTGSGAHATVQPTIGVTYLLRVL